MKPTPRLHLFLAGIGSSLLAISSSHAAPVTWDPAGGGTSDGAGAWLGTGKWWDGFTNVDWTSGDDATFGNGGAGGAVTLASPTTAGSITFNSFTGTYTLGTSGQALTLNGGITMNSGSGAATFVGPITLGGTQTWTNNSTGLLLTGNGTNLIDNGGFDLTVDGTGNMTFGVVNNSAVTLKGSGALVKNGSGTLSIGGDNSGAGGFTGDVILNNGKLFYGDFPGSLGAGNNIQITNGILEARWTSGITRAQGTTGPNTIQITGGESGFSGNGNTGVTFNIGAITWGSSTFNPTKFLLQSSASQSNSNVTIANSIDLNGTSRTIVVNGGTTGHARGTVNLINGTGTAGLVKEGEGWLQFGADPTYNGTTTISEGKFDFTNRNLSSMGGGNGVRDISVAAGVVVRRNALDNAFLNRIVETSAEFGVYTGGTNNNFDFSSSTGANLPNAFLGSWASNGAKTELGGTITPASDNYRLGYTGASGALGIKSTLTGTQGLIVGGQSVVLAADNTYSGNTVVRDGARLFIGRNLAMQNSALDTTTGSVSLHDTIGAGGIVGVEKTNSPTLGGIYGNRDFGAGLLSTSNQNNTTRLPLNQILGLTLNVATGKTFSWAGGLKESSTGTTLTKTGDGTQIISGASNYTGATNVDAGTLIIDGNISTSVLTTVKTGATLGGGGTIGDLTIDAGGFFSPGNSPGITTVEGDYIQNGTLVMELEGLTAGTQHDQVIVNGIVTLNGALNLAFNTFTPVNGDLIFILLNDDTDAITGTFSGLAQGAVAGTYGGFNWQISYVADSSGVAFTGGNDIALQAVAVPEPRAALLGGLGLLMLFRRRR